MGDGGVRPRGLQICTNCYSAQDTIRLMNVLIILPPRLYNLDCSLHLDGKDQYRIYIKEVSMPLLLRSPYCWFLFPPFYAIQIGFIKLNLKQFESKGYYAGEMELVYIRYLGYWGFKAVWVQVPSPVHH
jgi:hypothetical protein